MMRRPSALFLAGFVLAAAVSPPASAQQADNRPFILRLFGFGREAPPAQPGPQILQVPAPGRPKPAQPAPATPPASATGPAAAAPTRSARPAIIEVNPKNADAKLVLVIGDRLAGELGKGLDVAFSDRPDVVVETKSAAGSGLAAGDIDWKAWLDQRFGEGRRPVAVVVMLGLDDGVPIDLGDHAVSYPSADWETIYKARVDELIHVVADHHAPLFWVGLLPVEDQAATNDLSYVDSLIHTEVSEFGASYVDVWDAFARSGTFTFNGPDLDGQDRQLRLKDGVGFTRSGARKLAFFAEQGLRSWLAASTPSAGLLDRVSGDGYVMLLNDPSAAVEDKLLEPVELRPPRAGTPLYRLVVEGLPVEPVTGRADDPRRPAAGGS